MRESPIKRWLSFFIIQFYQPNERIFTSSTCLRLLYIISLKLKPDCDLDRFRSTICSPNLNAIFTHDPQLSSSFNLTEINPGRHPATRSSRLTVQDPDGRPYPEFNFNEIKSQSLMEILLSVHH